MLTVNAVNYNEDVEVFPLDNPSENIRQDVYLSPTDIKSTWSVTARMTRL